MADFTRILQQAQQGDPGAAEQLLPLVYEELRRLAASKMFREDPGQTLQPTALVHEAWLRLTGDENQKWNSCGHFFGAAAEAMRRILIERARKRKAARRGGGIKPLDISELELPSTSANEEALLLVNEALEKLAAIDPKKAELVKLRYFVGMTFEEASMALGIAVPTAKQWWAYARAWLSVEMRPSTDKIKA
jgi:RNA polymerase sigma factor (TIGR02999 family)